MAGPVVAAAIPPLLPTAIFPPTTCPVLAPPPPASHLPGRDWGGKKAGRASLSQSWIRDKSVGGGGTSPSKKQDSEKIVGRASSSESWVRDKLLGRTVSNEGCERAGRSASQVSWNGGKRPACRAPSADRCDKKPKPLTETDAGSEMFAGPTFVLSPEPSELPIPSLRGGESFSRTGV